MSPPESGNAASVAEVGPLWCDGMDAELPTLVPGADECLGAMRDVELLTYCTPTNGKINCPAAWWTDAGLAAFFALPGFGAITPPGYVGGKDIVSCTFWEAVQDEWWHDSIIRVNWQHNVWNPPSELMMRLMYDVRGWTCGGEPMTDSEREEIRENVRRSLVAAANRLEVIVA